MKLNIDYEDIKELIFEFNDEPLSLTSKIYPKNIEIKADEKTNTPYLYYEGIAMSNRGPVKIEFPRLDLIIKSIANTPFYNEHDYSGYPKTYFSVVLKYELLTEIESEPNKIICKVSLFNKEDWEQAKDFFGIGVKE